jgi:hypothetical protein
MWFEADGTNNNNTIAIKTAITNNSKSRSNNANSPLNYLKLDG